MRQLGQTNQIGSEILLSLLTESRFNDELRDYLDYVQINATYLSPLIQNEIINFAKLLFVKSW